MVDTSGGVKTVAIWDVVRLLPVYMWYWISIDILVCCLRAVGMVATTVCKIDVGNSQWMCNALVLEGDTAVVNAY